LPIALAQKMPVFFKIIILFLLFCGKMVLGYILKFNNPQLQKFKADSLEYTGTIKGCNFLFFYFILF